MLFFWMPGKRKLAGTQDALLASQDGPLTWKAWRMPRSLLPSCPGGGENRESRGWRVGVMQEEAKEKSEEKKVGSGSPSKCDLSLRKIGLNWAWVALPPMRRQL